MKKISVVILSVMMIFGCSACEVHMNVNTDQEDKQTEKVEVVKEVVKEVVSKQASDVEVTEDNASYENDDSAFYGVWCYGGNTEADAQNFAQKLLNDGFDARVFVTTDWENLNAEKYYVVTAGVCKTQQQAEQLLGVVKESGYSDAYVKYTGKRK